MLTSSLYVITSMLMPMTMPMSSYWRQGDEKKSVARSRRQKGRFTGTAAEFMSSWRWRVVWRVPGGARLAHQ